MGFAAHRRRTDIHFRRARRHTRFQRHAVEQDQVGFGQSLDGATGFRGRRRQNAARRASPPVVDDLLQRLQGIGTAQAGAPLLRPGDAILFRSAGHSQVHPSANNAFWPRATPRRVLIITGTSTRGSDDRRKAAPESMPGPQPHRDGQFKIVARGGEGNSVAHFGKTTSLSSQDQTPPPRPPHRQPCTAPDDVHWSNHRLPSRLNMTTMVKSRATRAISAHQGYKAVVIPLFRNEAQHDHAWLARRRCTDAQTKTLWRSDGSKRQRWNLTTPTAGQHGHKQPA